VGLKSLRAGDFPGDEPQKTQILTGAPAAAGGERVSLGRFERAGVEDPAFMVGETGDVPFNTIL